MRINGSRFLKTNSSPYWLLEKNAFWLHLTSHKHHHFATTYTNVKWDSILTAILDPKRDARWLSPELIEINNINSVITSCKNLRNRWKKNLYWVEVKVTRLTKNELPFILNPSRKASIWSPQSAFLLVSNKNTDSGHFLLWNWPKFAFSELTNKKKGSGNEIGVHLWIYSCHLSHGSYVFSWAGALVNSQGGTCALRSHAKPWLLWPCRVCSAIQNQTGV